MTEILCKWLNDDVKLSKKIEPSTFTQEFSSGYFFGEILNKHGLQDDFTQFSKSRVTNAKLNNFMRLEPTINLLDITFNTNFARDIMQEKQGSAVQLLYQMYIALTNKQKRQLTGAALETMRPQAAVKLEQYESQIYKNQLKAKTPRQTDLDLTQLKAKYEKFKIEQAEIAFEQKYKEEERQREELQNKRQNLLDKSKKFRLQQAELAARINDNYFDERGAAEVQIPKTPPKFKKEAIIERKRLFEKSEGELALREINAFEKKFKGSNRENEENDMRIYDIEAIRSYDDENEKQVKLDPVDYLKPKSNDDYIGKIRNRLQEDAHARKEREKRRRKVLVDQLRGNEQLEEAKREEMLVSHMLRQSQFERRIAVELLHARHEKDIIRENVIQREKEIEARREKEFYEALEREKELARLARIEYEEQVTKDKELYDLISADRAAQRYKENYDTCRGILLQIVDLSCKAGEYLMLNDNLIPPKLWRDWIKIYEAGLPLYEEDLAESLNEENLKEKSLVDEETKKLLDEGDFIEYKDMIGEWEFSNDSNTKLSAPEDNKIVGFIINRLHKQCYPVQPGAPAPLFPKFPLKTLILGKPFAGKTSALKLLARETGVKVIDVEKLITAAIDAYKRNPDLSIEQVESVKGQTTLTSPTPQPPVLPSLERSNTNLDKKKKKKDKEQDLFLQKERSQNELVSESEVQFQDETHMLRQLGAKAIQSLEAGEAIKDEIVVHIIIEKIRSLSDDKGWIIDGYPLTYNQAKLLEKAFTGFDADKPLPIRAKKEPILATNPKPDPAPPKHVSAIDLVIHLEVTNETILKRSAGRYSTKLSQKQFHQEFKPAPEGSYTGLNNVEVIEPVRDLANDMEQLQHRITSYEDNWGKVRKFYETYSNVTHLIADNLDEQTLSVEIHHALDEFIEERERRKREIEERKAAEEILKKQIEEDKLLEKLRKKQEQEAEAALAKQREAEREAAEREAATQSPSKSSKGNKKDSKKDSKGNKSPAKSSRKSASPKPKVATKKGSTPAPVEPEPQVETNKQDEQQPPKPGNEDWTYVQEKLQDNVAKILCDQWDIVEDSYVEGSKYVFRKIRGDREKIIRYFFNIKQDFKEYLRRPDHKQEFIDSFIKMYNSIADDMRDDEEVKAELHQRAEDLKEDLWSICDHKKDESEKEREAIKKDGWLADKIGILSNHYITLMQVEMDRFFETGRMLKDYYKCQQAPIPDDLPREYPRLPLIELRDPEDVESEVDNISSERQRTDEAAAATAASTQVADKPKSPKSSRKGSAKSPKPSSAKKDAKAPLKKGTTKSSSDFEDAIKKRRIPLIPRRPTSADVKDKKKEKAKKVEDTSPPPPEDADEKLIFDSFKAALSYVNEFMSLELAQYEDEDKGEAPAQENKQAKQSKSKGVVLSKSRSPSAKGGKGGKAGAKGAKPQDEVVAQPALQQKITKMSVVKNNFAKNVKDFDSYSQISEVLSTKSSIDNSSNLTEEERAKKALRDRVRQEHTAALQREEQAFKTRLEVIKQVATRLIQNLNQIADNCYKDMDDWLGSKWMKEMDSIKGLIELIKNMIENKEKIKEQLMLKQDEFYIDSDIVVLRSPTPQRRPEPIEQITPEIFSIEALNIILDQFKLVAPEGLVATKTFVDIYTDLATLNYGTEIMPENWCNLSATQVEALAKMLSNNSEFVDWRHWLLYASVPWPYPSQDSLLDTLRYFQRVSKNGEFVNEDEFMRAHLWFNMETPPTPNDITQPRPFNRYNALLAFWFRLFSNEHGLIDYKNMLLYMSASTDPYEGFLKALSVSQAAPMPRLDTKVQMKVSGYVSHSEYENLKQTNKYPDDQLVSNEALHRVFHHGERLKGDTHRFASSEDPEDFMSMERILNIYSELSDQGVQTHSSLLYSKLIAHPVLCEMISNCTKFRAPEFRVVFNMQSSQDDNNDIAQDRRTPND